MDSLLRELDSYDVSGDSSQSTIKNIIRDHIQTSGSSVFDVRSSGHVTASALCYNLCTEKFLIQKHRVLDLWLPFGGHGEPGEIPYQTASREFNEESGLSEFRLLSENAKPILLDLDVHSIPATEGFGAHFHLDFRYLVLVEGGSRRVPVCHAVKECVWINGDDMVPLIRPNLQRYLSRCLEGIRSLTP